MSGFEVAGIVLGSIPLIVSAVEAYINFMKGWGKVTSELRSLNRQLTTERAKLYNVCDQLLADLVPQRDIEPMLQDPMGPLWYAAATNDKIRRVLWNSYIPFEKMVLEIREALADIMERLKIQVTPEGQVEWVTKARMTREFKKFLYRLNRKDYYDTLSTISNRISDLEALARLSIRLEPVRRKRSRGRVLKLLRDLSTSIYHALFSSFLCNDLHYICLALTSRSIEVGYEDKDEKVLYDAQFTVAISFEVADGPGKAVKRFWDEMSIKTAKQPAMAPPPPPSPTLSVCSTAMTTTTTTMTATTMTTTTPRTSTLSAAFIEKKVKKVKKGVSFSIIQTLSSIGSSPKPPPPDIKVVPIISLARDITDVAFVKPIVSDPDGAANPLVDLCTALQKAREARPPCYGYLIDKHSDHTNHHFSVCPHGTATTNSDTWSIVTLRDVLEQKAASGDPNSQQPPLTSLKDKIRLGLAIASSVLQLSKTPWLPSVPTSNNVHFFKRGHILSYQHPFLLRTFPDHQHRPNSPPPQQQPPPSQTSSGTVDRNATLFALGILLMEILLGSTLDQLRSPQEAALSFAGDESGIIRDSMTAFRLLEQRVALINPSYKVVVERCMECTAGRNLDEEDFRQEVYSGVVMELEAILDHTKLGAW